MNLRHRIFALLTILILLGSCKFVAAQEKKNGGPRLAPGPGGRSRAEQDPVVRRMQEKFGAEIRTVIDYRDKR